MIDIGERAQRAANGLRASMNGHGHEPNGIISAAALVRKDFPEPRYAVRGVVPDGATLLVGAPKKGKSWLLLGLGVAVAAGGRALGKIAVDAGDVLILALEDSERRLQERLWRLLDGECAPDRLSLVTTWPRLDEGGDVMLDAWLRGHPETRLVGIDVLARLRPPSRERGDAYQRDYDTMVSFKQVADRHGVALVVVHHTRKASADDPLDTISGTNGLGGAADTALILTRERGRADGNLYVRGRDVPEADYALSFDPVTCRWSVLGNADDFRLSAGRADIQALLMERGPLSPIQVAEALQANRGTIRSTLYRMYNAGQVVERGGLYDLPLSTPAAPATPATDRITRPNFPVAPPVAPNGGATPLQQAEIRMTTPSVADVAAVAGSIEEVVL